MSRNPEYTELKKELLARLHVQLIHDGDPRLLGYGDIFESYPRMSKKMRPELGGFSESGKYNPKYIQEGQEVPESEIGTAIE